jgi:hypothetical protein
MTPINTLVTSLAWSIWAAMTITNLALWDLTLLVGHSLSVGRPNVPLPRLTYLILDYSFVLIAIPIVWLIFLITCHFARANGGMCRYCLCGMIVTNALVTAWTVLALIVPWLPHKL